MNYGMGKNLIFTLSALPDMSYGFFFKIGMMVKAGIFLIFGKAA